MAAGTTAASARRHLEISRGSCDVSSERQLSDISALSITNERRDLVPFRTTTSYSELKIHSTNVAAGDFQTGRLSGLKVILASLFLRSIAGCPCPSPSSDSFISPFSGEVTLINVEQISLARFREHGGELQPCLA